MNASAPKSRKRGADMPRAEKRRVAVRTLVETVMRAGSLEPGASAERLAEGISGHRALQAVEAEGVRNEVSVSCEARSKRVALSVYGRIDRLYPPEGPDGLWTLEEIKTTLRSADTIDAPNPQHRAQAVCYAHMLCEADGLDAAAVRVTYLELGSGEIKSFDEKLSRDELAAEFFSLAENYLGRLEAQLDHMLALSAELDARGFPYESYREGQRRLASQAYVAVRDGRTLVAEAPTGIGKTMAVLFPAVKALGEGSVERLFCLTARTTGQLAAADAVRAIGAPSLRAVVITAREKACPFDTPRCRDEGCAFAEGYYDRLDGALSALNAEGGLFTRERIAAAAARFMLCPFELALDLSTTADIVICDYNYAFDPRVRLQRFFMRGKQKQALLIDEAHNLPDRARGMYSSVLRLEDVDTVRRLIPASQRKAAPYKALLALSKAVKACFNEESAPHASDEPPPAELVDACARAAAILSDDGTLPGAAEARELSFALTDFVYIAGLFDPAYAALYEGGTKTRTVTLLCADPSPKLAAAYKKCSAEVFYSATLQPFGFYLRLLGLAVDTPCLALPSPFPQENLKVMQLPLNTRYRYREQTLMPAAEAAAAFARSRENANFIIFLPSHEYLSRFREALEPLVPDARLIVQERTMDDAARADFLDCFSPEPKGVTLALAVMGGIFAESIDLAAQRLSGAVIVGVGLPQVCLERDVLRARYEANCGDGYAYAYMYPGMGRVLQAAGRIIRTPEDTGALLLMDDRYSNAAYSGLMPENWRVERMRSAGDVEAACRRFWENG